MDVYVYIYIYMSFKSYVYLHSANRGAVETECSDLHSITGCFTI